MITATKEDLLNDVLQSRCFKTNTHAIANTCHIPDADAEQLLIIAVDKRGITELDKKMEWKITYSAKDVISSYFKRQKDDEGLINKLEEAPQPKSIQEQVAELGYSNREILNIISLAIPNKKTQIFAGFVLLHGDKETMQHFGLTTRQFKRKLSRLVKYAEQHKTKFKEVVDEYEMINIDAELETLKQYTTIMETSEDPEVEVAELFHDYAEYYTNLVGECTPYIKEPNKILNHYWLANKQDQYSLNNYIYDRIEKLEDKKSKGSN
jgi:hypothetical protein